MTVSSTALCEDPTVEERIKDLLPRALRAYLHGKGIRVNRAPESANNIFGYTDFSRLGISPMPQIVEHGKEGVRLSVELGEDAKESGNAEMMLIGETVFEMALEELAVNGPANGMRMGPGPYGKAIVWGFYDADTKIVWLDADHWDDYTIVHELGHAFQHAKGDGWLANDKQAKHFFQTDRPSDAWKTGDDEGPNGGMTEWFADCFARYFHQMNTPNPDMAGRRDLQPETRRWLGKLIATTVNG